MEGAIGYLISGGSLIVALGAGIAAVRFESLSAIAADGYVKARAERFHRAAERFFLIGIVFLGFALTVGKELGIIP